jgi:hypothetical protein
MKKLLSIFFVALSLLSFNKISAQQISRHYAVMLQADVTNNPKPKITLSWTKDGNTTNQYLIFRRIANSSQTFTSSIASLSANDTFFVDTNVTEGSLYEYRIDRSGTGFTTNQGRGYITSGINIPAIGDRGTLLLLVESKINDTFPTQLKNLEDDIRNDGYRVKTLLINRAESVMDVKAKIIAEYQKVGNELKTIFILGRVAVPYSGQVAIDGHTPDHNGAWPADIFYGHVNPANQTSWTDVSVNETRSTREKNKNIPGDGKFDNDILPSDATIQVGRVDFDGMPTFGDEYEILERYLRKNHLWKTNQLKAEERGLVRDNFGAMGGEAFSASGYYAFSAMFGNQNLVNLTTSNYRDSLRNGTYTFAYGTGAGSYTSAGGVVNSNNFVSDSLLAPFNMLFGSYFGDWDSDNNLLRAPLASKGWGLTNAWSGRPRWVFHHMAMGYNIGHSQLLSVNDYQSYPRNPTLPNASQRLVTPALMGDPTLRLHPMNPLTNLIVSKSSDSTVFLQWLPVSGADHYIIYRADSINGKLTAIENSVTKTDYTDKPKTYKTGLNTFYYLVKPAKLKQSASGTYINTGLGKGDTVSIVGEIKDPVSIAQNTESSLELLTFPNPATQVVYISANGLNNAQIQIISSNGKVINPAISYIGENIYKLDISNISSGLYLINVIQSNKQFKGKFIKK